MQKEMFASGGTGRPTQVAHARRTDPATSHEAAARASVGLTKKQYAVLSIFEVLYPLALTDPELQREYRIRQRPLGHIQHQSESGIRTRRKELCDLGLLQFAGRRDRHQAWCAVPVGERKPVTVRPGRRDG